MQVLESINRGGFGRVDKVKDASGRIVARKTFDPTHDVLAASDINSLRKRFNREVKVQSSLSSDYFISVLESDLTAAQPWFTMPLADRNFFDVVTASRKSGDVPSEALFDIINALEELHSLGFAHRDLKPQNILEFDGRWRISDFGLVLPPSGMTSTLTRSGSAWGSAPWCAPEQSLDFKHVTSSADIYAFGAILHDVFTDGKRVPYQKQTCPGAIGFVVEKCTEVDPRKRFKSISDVRTALFTALSVPAAIKPSADASSWIAKLDEINKWTVNEITDFIRLVAGGASPDDKSAIFHAIDEDKLSQMNAIDGDLFNTVAIELCGWAEESFDFSYCDVLVGRLEMIFKIGSYECKARAAISTAGLGAYHNRWYVMKRLVGMCGPSIDDNLARRIAIEIIAEDAQHNFRTSVDGIGQTTSSFHPAIASVLDKKS
ncbi:MAG: hypothetical protein A2283_18985 [Lentisphaerae bacterium RIFOXYA12_FULL_48_11]|nr:MAG: hypothetical protein A2283_18985 [Lentisphaerae bacterium RIFOXYA12_FULL_48_11]